MENLYVDIGTQRVLEHTTTSVNSFWLLKKKQVGTKHLIQSSHFFINHKKIGSKKLKQELPQSSMKTNLMLG